MRVLFIVGMKNAIMIKFINAHRTACVDDLLIFQYDTYMNNVPFFIIKKCQVACLRFFHKA